MCRFPIMPRKRPDAAAQAQRACAAKRPGARGLFPKGPAVLKPPPALTDGYTVIIYHICKTRVFQLISRRAFAKRKKQAGAQGAHPPVFHAICAGSAFADRAYGALAGARAAIQARVRIDYILAVAFRNGIHRANTGAGATGDAVVADFVSHTTTFLLRAVKSDLRPLRPGKRGPNAQGRLSAKRLPACFWRENGFSPKDAFFPFVFLL